MADKLLGKKGSALEDQLRARATAIDRQDPIYDSESEDEDCYFAQYEPSKEELLDRLASGPTQDGQQPTIGKAALPLSGFAAALVPIFQEFFASGAMLETVEVIKSLESPQYFDFFVVRLVRASLDQTDVVQQRTAELLTLLYDGKHLTRQHISRGFEKLVHSVDDLRLDVPDAADRLMAFFICATEDKVVDPHFLRRLPESFIQLLLLSEEDEDLAVRKQLTELRQYKTDCADMEADFFNSGETKDLCSFLSVRPSEFRHEFVKHLVKASFDRTDWEREMVSKALTELFGPDVQQLTPDDVQLGFSRLLGMVDDLLLDCPEATILLAKYTVRAIVDEVLPPIFVKQQKRLNVGGTSGQAVIQKLESWLRQKKGHMMSQQFRKVWTGTDISRKEARDFKDELRMTLFEYFDNGDVQNAIHCVRQMDLAPDQDVEMVRKLMTCAMERDDLAQKAAVKLLCALVEKEEIDKETVKHGFDQSYARLADIGLDVPRAGEKLDMFCIEAQKCQILSENYMKPHQSNGLKL